jgi:ribonuclease Z
VDLDIVFLGTSASAPTAGRAPNAVLVRRGGDRLLFDCAEGTQRQLMRSSLGLPDLDEIYLTHYHADHTLGLPGLLKTFSLRGRDVPLTVYGPPGLRELFTDLRRVFGKVTYPLETVEVRPGDALERDGYRILVFPVHHGVSAVGYAVDEPDRPGEFDAAAADVLGIPFGPERGELQRGESVTLADGMVVTPDTVLGSARKGRRVVITGDTAPVETVRVLAEGADVLVHEATFSEE